MKVYYKDIHNDQDQWSHLEIQVEETIKPGLRLYAGGQKRFKLASSNRVHFWGSIDRDYFGAWILYNPIETALEDMPIPPISASIVQTAPLKGEEKLIFWSKYFTNSITKSQNSLFHTGKWKISSKLALSQLLKKMHYSKKEASEVHQGFYSANPTYLNWGFNGNFTMVAIKPEPKASTSRVKRWRKEVRNGTCPPVLAWYVSCLCAYVILDGHSRLKAFHCEEVTPDIMVLESIIEHQREPNPEAGNAMIKNIEARQNHEWKPPKSVEEINNLLISVFDNRPFESSVSKSLAQVDFDSAWLEELAPFKSQEDIDQETLEDMIVG